MKTKNTKKRADKEAFFISLERVIACMPGSVFWKDKDGIYRGCNDGMVKLAGYRSESEVVGKNDYDVVSHMGVDKKVAESFVQIDQEVISTGVAKLNLEEIPFASINGYIINQLTSKAPLYDELGNIVGLVGISIDITDLKKAREDLQAAKEKAEKKAEHALENLERILACMPGSVYWKDKNGVYQGCNDAMSNMLGLSKSEALGKTDYDFGRMLGWSKEITEAFVKADRKVIETGVPKLNIEELPFYFADGKIINQLTNKVPIKDENGNVVGVIGISIDITKQKETERMLAEQVEKTNEAYHSKAEFLATASHEIRNPIGNVIYSIENTSEHIGALKNIFYDAIDMFNENGQQEIVKQIQALFKQIYDQNEETKAESFRALNALINLGELHRLQQESLEPNFETSNIQDLIKLAIDNSTYPNKSKVDIHLNINSIVPQEIVIDYHNIYEALRVIIGNAIRFSDMGGIVKITANTTKQDNQGFLTILVQDYGIGIAESQLEHIFETLHISTHEEAPSNYWKPSLQLPQAKMRVEASGGKLNIKSAIKKGAIVTITVPYYEANSEFVSNQILDDKFAAIACSILLVEDDAYAQKTVKSYLEESKHRVDIASTSEEAVEMAGKKNYDVILMDITLPDKNGVETKKIIQDIVDNKPLFIAVTSHAKEIDADYFISQGFVTVLAKPVNKLSLKKCIKNAIIARVSEDNEDD